MFEKEAEKYISNLDECRTKDLMRDSFKDGAEFGYNKAKEELEKENAELKEQVENPKLNKAKEIIKDYLTIVKGSYTTVCGVPEEDRTINVLKLNEEAEQFLEENT